MFKELENVNMRNYDPKQPYNHLPLLLPVAELESHAVLKKCVEAHKALAALKEIGASIPNQTVLINTIPIRESQASSEIENIVTTTDQLFQQASLPDRMDSATKETLSYRTALFEGFQDLQTRPLSTATAVKICSIIRNMEVDIRTVPGTALKNTRTSEVLYTPPEGEKTIRTLLANWESFLHDTVDADTNTDLDPLVRMAVGHYQFEAIHPFSDGNGRTGRILNILFLVSEGLLNIPVLYLSKYILENRRDYYRLLQQVTEKGLWEDWILFMLDAVKETAQWTTEKIRSIQQLMEHACDYVKQQQPRIYSRELVELFFIQPYCRIEHVVEAGIAKRATASKYLWQMCHAGLLTPKEAGRHMLYVNAKFLHLLVQDDNHFTPYAPSEPTDGELA